MPKTTLALILAGGQGDRLSILSDERAKPAVVFGGKYRIIDFVLSNCRNSGITNVGVLTQYRPRSLNDHIGSGRPWDLDRDIGGISLLQPYLGREESDWYRGTADAVYHNLYFVEESGANEVLVLAGDHIYITAYDDLIAFHRANKADVTVPVYDVPPHEASRYGILEMEADHRVTAFWEKPADPRGTLASTGIYVFNTRVLIDRLRADAEREDSSHDFGNDILPAMIHECRVFGYPLRGYWRDVGTVEAYWQANMDLLVDLPELNLYDPRNPVRTRATHYPPAKMGPGAEVRRSLLNSGAIINGFVEHSVVSPGVYIEAGAVVRDSIIFDGCTIEAGAVVERAVLDKEVRVRAGCMIGAGDNTPNHERPNLLNSGITIIGKRASLPAGLQIGRNCVVGPAVSEEDFDGLLVPSGATIHGESRPA